jgi:hypothetical protein
MNTPVSSVFGRREFLGRFTLTVGASLVAAALPVSLLQAAPAGLACTFRDPCGDWHVDDMCAAYPPYAFRVDAGVPSAGRMTAQIAPIDQYWVS